MNRRRTRGEEEVVFSERYLKMSVKLDVLCVYPGVNAELEQDNQ